ncbi:unnamed protein product [Phytophthora fragariaefolia]|uniref:Unnamed protein product n=1 Tax=Phytophthora fragariaefolia TaxID=1490495 RepID=A0A9W6XUF0_9STRA|nr:unnamed protein product [Phytophthora fragariaefolia]
MRQVEKECNELDWTSSHGAAVGGSRVMPHDESTLGSGESSGHRLGGGSARASRLLLLAPQAANVESSLVSATKSDPVQTQLAEPKSIPASIELYGDIEMKEEAPEAAPPKLAEAPQSHSLKVRTIAQRYYTIAERLY